MYMKKIMHKEKMNYDRRKNDSLIHTLLDDMKKMNDVITRLQQEITHLGREVQELRQSVARSSHGPGEEDGYNHISTHPDPESHRSREMGKFEKQKELLVEQGREPAASTSNPWDNRHSTKCHHTVSHF